MRYETHHRRSNHGKLLRMRKQSRNSRNVAAFESRDEQSILGGESSTRLPIGIMRSSENNAARRLDKHRPSMVSISEGTSGARRQHANRNSTTEVNLNDSPSRGPLRSLHVLTFERGAQAEVNKAELSI